MAHDFIYLECRQMVDVKNEIWYRLFFVFLGEWVKGARGINNDRDDVLVYRHIHEHLLNGLQLAKLKKHNSYMQLPWHLKVISST